MLLSYRRKEAVQLPGATSHLRRICTRHERLKGRLSISRSARPSRLLATAVFISLFLVPVMGSSSVLPAPHGSDSGRRLLKAQHSPPPPTKDCPKDKSCPPPPTTDCPKDKFCPPPPNKDCPKGKSCPPPPPKDCPKGKSCPPPPMKPSPSPLTRHGPPPPVGASPSPPPPPPVRQFRPPPPLPYPPPLPPPSPASNRNEVAAKVGWSFLSFALLLQVALGGFLAYKRWELQR